MIRRRRVYCRAGFSAAERPFKPWRPAYYAARVTRENDRNKLCFIGADISGGVHIALQPTSTDAGVSWKEFESSIEFLRLLVGDVDAWKYYFRSSFMHMLPPEVMDNMGDTKGQVDGNRTRRRKPAVNRSLGAWVTPLWVPETTQSRLSST